MSDDKQTNGWNEYSKLVLKELETLADGMDALQKEMQEVRRDIAKIEAREAKFDEVKEWKAKMEEVISPAQLKELVKEHRENREFVIRAVTVLAVVQFLISGTIIWMKIFSK